MNIFEEIKNRNIQYSAKLAMSARLDDGTQRSFTYGETFERATLFSEVLTKMGIVAGDRVAIIAQSSPEWSMAFLAIAKLQATAALIDASLDGTELRELLTKSDVRCLFASPNATEKLGDMPQMPTLNILTPPSFYLSETAPILTARTATNDGDKNASSLIYSSGTTKKASGILHTHESLLLSAQMCMDGNFLKTDDRFLAILPNSHIYGLLCQVVGPLLLGSSICFLESLSASALVGAFTDFHPSILPAVPKVYELLKTQILLKINANKKTQGVFKVAFPACLKLRRTTGINLGKSLFHAVHDNFGGNLRILCSAGAPINPETAEFFYGLGFDVLVTYGATETGIPTIGNRVGHITTDTCGTPYPTVAVKLGEGGEILIKTPYRMIGYFRDAAATDAAFDSDGWFRSGDLGSIDETNHVKILGRCKENIVLSTGKKVAPDDIESAYVGISGVRELVVCGIPVDTNGIIGGGYDEVHAFVVADISAHKEVLAQLKKRSAGVSQSNKLSGVHFVESIPKTSLQKPKRFLLQQMMTQNDKPEDTLAAVSPKNVPALVLDAVARAANASLSDFTMNTRLFKELTIDSLSSLELAYDIEERCGVRVEHMLHWDMTVEELISCVVSPEVEPTADKDGQYPRRKHQLEYNLFCITRRLFRSVYRVKVKDDKNLPENSGYIICANHVSNFDYLYLTLNFNKDRFFKFCCMAKKELFHKNWINRKIASVCGMVPVDRSGLVTDAMVTIREKLTEKWGVLIHPEGMRSKDGEMGTFKNGAAVLAIETGVPVVPAYIKGGYEVFPCWKKMPLLFNWRKMRKYQVEVIYGAPISPLGLTSDELMDAVKTAVVALAKTVASPVASM